MVTLFTEVRYKAIESSHATCELLYILDACWSFHVGDGGDLVRVGFNAMSVDDVA